RAHLVLGGGVPRPALGAGRLVEQAGAELGRRLVFARRQGLAAAPLEGDLEGAARTLGVRLQGPNLGGGRARPAAQQRGLVTGGPQGLVQGEVSSDWGSLRKRSVGGPAAA